MHDARNGRSSALYIYPFIGFVGVSLLTVLTDYALRWRKGTPSHFTHGLPQILYFSVPIIAGILAVLYLLYAKWPIWQSWRVLCAVVCEVAFAAVVYFLLMIGYMIQSGVDSW